MLMTCKTEYNETHDATGITSGRKFCLIILYITAPRDVMISHCASC